MKILFLDIDGVLVTDTCDVWQFVQEAVENLQVILENSDCKIVISSSWAMQGRDTIVDRFKKNGFDIEQHLHEDWAILDMSESSRKGEMIQWLRKHPEVVAHVAIDDKDYDLPHQVLTDPMLGIVDSTVDQALELLDQPRFPLE